MQTGLAPLGSRAIKGGGFTIADTTAGLLVLQCGTSPQCARTTIGVLNLATGGVSHSVTVPAAGTLLRPRPAALTSVSAVTYLVRVAG